VIEASAEIAIRAPAEKVFDFLADARNEPEWLPGAQRVAKVTDGDVGLGTRFEGLYSRAGAVDLELVEFERPRRLTFRASSRVVAFDDAVTLEEGDGTTLLRARMEAQPRGPMRVVAPVMARTMRRQFEKNWKHLKTALERDRE
jgi:carbon monoxide dehydrogenase subunit G